jgi:spermidine synthase
MIPWQTLDAADIPGGGDQLRLKRRGAEFSIMLGVTELMNSRLSGSEEALATLTAQRLPHVDAPTVLIGGLGMGFTLRAALAAFGDNARLVISELVPAVVDWARGPMAELFAGSLDDLRVSILEKDVTEIICGSRGHYDAILLDVDNGPDGLTRASNDRLYNTTGLAAGFAALKPGGVLAVWSSAPDTGFTNRLRRTGFSVDEVMVRAHRGKRGAKHTIWLASRT